MEFYPSSLEIVLTDTVRHPEIKPYKQICRKEKKHDWFSFGKICSFFKIEGQKKIYKHFVDDVDHSILEMETLQQKWKMIAELFCQDEPKEAMRLLEEIGDAPITFSKERQNTFNFISRIKHLDS